MSPASQAFIDSGCEWIGSVPAHWSVSKIKYESYVKARVGWQNLRSDEFVDEGPYCITGTDFKNGTIDWASAYHVSEERYEMDPYIQLKGTDLLITKDGTIGKLALVGNIPGRACLNSGVFVVRPLSERYVSRYLYWILSSNVFRHFIDIHTHGSTINHLYQNVFERFAFPIPSVYEQMIISQFLDRETGRINDLITEKQNFINLLKEKRQALISHVVTKGLDPNVEMKDSGVEWIGEIPKHWSVKPYKYACKIYRGKFSHRPRNDPAFYDGQHPFIQTGDVSRADGFITSYKQTLNDMGASVSKKFPSGTLVMTIAANIGDTAILGFDAYAPDSIVGFKPEKDTDLNYLRYGFDSSIQELERTSIQNTQSNLNIDRIGSIKFVFPPLLEQIEIVKHIELKTKKLDAIISEVTESIELLKEHRTALISAAVTGKIDPRDKEVA